jgi:hypothetical protein
LDEQAHAVLEECEVKLHAGTTTPSATTLATIPATIATRLSAIRLQRLGTWNSAMEEKEHFILEECEAKLQRDKEQMLSADSSVWQNLVMGKGWLAIRLQRLGTWKCETFQECSETYLLYKLV